MKDLCVKLGGWGALLICLPVMWRIHEGDKINPVSFLLWSLLSLICTIVLVRAKKGGHTMMAGYVLSDFSIGFYAYMKGGRAEFGKFEWFIIVVTTVCICLYLWCERRKNFTPAVIVNATACVLAGIPMVLDAFQNPFKISFVICGLYIMIAWSSYYGEKSNLNGRLIPGVSIVYWIVVIVGVIISRHI